MNLNPTLRLQAFLDSNEAKDLHLTDNEVQLLTLADNDERKVLIHFWNWTTRNKWPYANRIK